MRGKLDFYENGNTHTVHIVI